LLRGITRGALLLPFFLLVYIVSATTCEAQQELRALNAAEDLDIHNDPTWRSLMHYARGRCFVDDSTFYLSKTPCSLVQEMRELISASYSSDSTVRQDVACRFPARIAFVRAMLHKVGVSLPTEHCAAVDEFRAKAPADNISLVFASENITHPMSMMGHVFLKFSGKSATGSSVDHAASFFTRISGINIPGLVLDGLFLGMPAFFALVPYSEQINGYRINEGRNIFEYPLVASDLQRQLIHEHVWELRTIKSPYLFVGYNCATVVYFLISLANPELLDELGWWITPIDVVRKAEEDKVTTSRHFIPSIDWEVRFFGQQLGPPVAGSIASTMNTGSPEEVRELVTDGGDPLRLAFATALLEREKLSNTVKEGRLEDLSRLLSEQSLTTNGTEFEVQNLKDPATGPRSSRITVGAAHFNGKGYGKLELLPTSHSVTDDNRRSYSESMLELAEVSLLVNPIEDAEVLVQKANLYGMESFVPYDPFIGGVSSRLIVGAQQEWDGALSPYTAAHVTLGIGRSIQTTDDSTIYGLVNGAVSYGDGRLAPYYFPEIGAIVYEILSMKTVANYRITCGQHGSENCYQSVNIHQSVLLSDELSPYANFTTLWNDDTSTHMYELGLKIYF
jgi:hypothetical protein